MLTSSVSNSIRLGKSRCMFCVWSHGCRKFVSTWTPLTSAFNTKPRSKLNLSLYREETGLFGVPELKNAEGFYLLKENAVHRSDDLVEEACSSSRSRKIVKVFDDLSNTLCRVADLSEFIRTAHPQERIRVAAQDASSTMSGVVEKLNTHVELFASLKNVVSNGDVCSTNPLDDHVAKLFMFDFELSGIHLPVNERKKVVNLNAYILYAGHMFMANSLAHRRMPYRKLPENLWKCFSLDGDNVVVTGLYSDSPQEVIREAAYKIFLNPDPEQERLLVEMLVARHGLARLCGFPTFAHRALKGSLAEAPEMVDDFTDSLSERLRPFAEEEFAEMSKLKEKNEPGSQELSCWDPPYLTHLAKSSIYKINLTEYSPYFSLGSCMEGLSQLFTRLYNIELRVEKPTPGELWSADVYKLAVVHHKEGLLGYIYCDFYDRPGKPHQDSHFTISGGKLLDDGTYQLPVVVLLLNLPSPTWSRPSLLTPGMVDNLFHEVGHAMHSMLARTPYQHITGTRCTVDFAEVPSTLMELFASDPRVLSTFAYHYKTGEPIPSDMLVRLCALKNIYPATETQQQVFYSALDQRFHNRKLGDCSTTDIIAEVHQQYYGLPYVPNTAWQHRFGHLVGYGAKYYSYLFSRAMASLIWQRYFQEDPFSSSSGEKFRHKCLSHGGGKPAQDLVSDYLGETLTYNTLVDALLLEIETRRSRAKNMCF